MTPGPRGSRAASRPGAAAFDADVVVVGAGPVGLLLALLLGRGGWRVEILERHLQPFDQPRAVHLDHESARILQHAGVMHDLSARVEPMDSYLWRNGAGDPLLWLDGGAGRPTPSGWPASLMFFQPDLEALLTEALAEQPTVGVRRGCEVRTVGRPGRGEADRVQVGAVGADGQPLALDARWVVGCDGAGSRVRQVAGLKRTDLGQRHTWLVADVRPDDLTPWSPLNLQVCDPARPTTAVSGGPGRRRFEFLRLPDDPPFPGDPAATTELIWGLLAPWGLAPGNAVLDRAASYTFAASVVDDWRRGRVLVAGDAAHQMPPFAGQGLCAGLRDAANLAWKLDLVLAGQAPERLLDTYGTERAPQVREEIDFSVELGKLVCVLDPEQAAARDTGLRTLAGDGPQPLPERPPLGPGLWHPGDPNAGVPALQATVTVAGRRRLLDDVTGGGWTLLTSGSDTVPGRPGRPGRPGDLDRWWASIGGRRYGIGPAGDLGDPDGAYARWFASLGAGTVLVRPDAYVYGGAPARHGAELLGSLRAALDPSQPPSAVDSRLTV